MGVRVVSPSDRRWAQLVSVPRLIMDAPISRSTSPKPRMTTTEYGPGRNLICERIRAIPPRRTTTPIAIAAMAPVFVDL